MLRFLKNILDSDDAGGFNGGGPNCQASEPVALLKEHPARRQNRRIAEIPNRNARKMKDI